MRHLLSLLFIALLCAPFVMIGIAIVDRVPGIVRTHAIAYELMFVMTLIMLNIDAIMAFIKEHF